MNQLEEFIDILLKHPRTTIFSSLSRNNDSHGCSIENEKLNIGVEVFSDINNFIYWEFSFLLDKSKECITQEFPLYKVNLENVKPLLDKIFYSMDFAKDKQYPNSSKYISIFRSFLKNENLPPNFKISKNDSGYQLIENNVPGFYLSEVSITNLEQKLNEKKAPTFLHSLNIKKNDKKFYFYIPHYALLEYRFLKVPPTPEEKYQNTTTDFEDILNSLRNFGDVKKTEAHQILHYFELNENLKNKCEKNNSSDKKKLKL